MLRDVGSEYWCGHLLFLTSLATIVYRPASFTNAPNPMKGLFSITQTFGKEATLTQFFCSDVVRKTRIVSSRLFTEIEGTPKILPSP